MPDLTYTEARASFASIWDRLVADRDVAVIHRRGKEPLAMLPASELAGLLETAHLLRSPANAERLFAALADARAARSEETEVEDLRARLLGE
ncbi:MAG: type II toxin-antitoxin system Phd/YefM family antitoxin [Rhodothermales bacterium]|mgnify:CR=1 FL=1|nr:type II toxin-antitoxin system Phd/YefM family antitoxin [Rhodothermales bacterium]